MFWVCVKIFFARILDVSISTVRQHCMLKDHFIISPILAFWEILIWFLVAREALLISIDSIFVPISYSLGYATGTIIGSFLAKTFVKGVVGIQIIIKEENKELLKSLKEEGYRVNIIPMKSLYDKENRTMLFLEASSKSIKKIERLVLAFDETAFITINETKKVVNGTLK